MDDELRTEFRQADILPKGYIWVMWTDGSGFLKCPDGSSRYEYDMSPYFMEGGIEYVVPETNAWNVFWGSFEAFKTFAEEKVLSMIQN